MTPTEILLIVVLVVYAIYRQSQKHEVVGSTRFKMAIIYGIVGVAVGGFHRPDATSEWVLLGISLLLSMVVGLARGRYSKMWVESPGHVFVQGTPLTIGLFLGMVLVKFGLGTWAHFEHISDDGGFGEVIIMIALMIAFQAQIVWKRAQPLGAAQRSDETADSQV